MLFNPKSYMGSEIPQQNQFLTGNPSTDTNAQTDWMNPSSSDSNWASPSYGQQDRQTFQSPSTGLLGNGTALSSLTAGNNSWMMPSWGGDTGGNTGIAGGFVNQGGPTYDTGPYAWGNQSGQQPWFDRYLANTGQFSGQGGALGQPQFKQPANQPTSSGMSSAGQLGQYTPEGYDINKLRDPANANSLKYQIGRILSNFAPGEAGLQQAAGQLASIGARVIGRDRVQLPDGTTVDVGRSFSDPNAQHAWQYNWSGPGGGGGGNQGQPTSFMGAGGQQKLFQSMNMSNPNFLQQLFQSLQNNRRMRFNRMDVNPQAGDMVSNGWGGMMPYDPNFTGVT